MTSDPSTRFRQANGRRLQRRRAVGIVAAGAVLFPLLGAIPTATAAPGGSLAPAALAGMLPTALPSGPTGVGPVDPDNGYPYWYGDAGLPEQDLEPVRLELCVDIAECPAAAPEPGAEAGYDPNQPLSIPENFPEEAFWWSAEASMDLAGGATARLIMAQEAAFGGDGSVAAGQQNAFSRIRVRIEDGVPGATYTVTHPYGVEELTADDRGRVRFTEDIGCLQQPCTWQEPTKGRIGPFLRWSGNEAPAGTVGDPNVPHTVVGSPNNTNYFEIVGPNSTGEVVTDRTDMFNVMGQIATLKADVDKPGGLYNQSQTIKIQASMPHEAKIVWTTDGTDPTVDAEGNVTNGEVYTPTAGEIDPAALVTLATPGITTLKFIAVDMATNAPTQVYTEEYELDVSTPWVEATPAASGPLAGPQTVTLTGRMQSGEVPTVYYTTDGSAPQYTAEGPLGTTREYTGPLTVHFSTVLRAVAVDALGNAGQVLTLPYTIHNLQSIGEVGEHGFPVTLTDNGFGDHEPVTLDLCLDDPLCPNVAERPNPDLPTSWPDNFPGEAFWWAADAEMEVDGERVRLVLASEAAFAMEEPIDGDQIAFGRIRVRGDAVFQPGATYLVTHPYGTIRVVADADGDLNYTEDMGAMNGGGNFAPLLEAKIGPFLRWDEGAPAGYLGDGTTPHTVIGSPYDTNFFKLEQITNAAGEPLAAPVELGRTDEFIVQGRTEGATPPAETTAPTVEAQADGGVFAAPQTVQLTAAPATARIFFTLDGTQPSATNGTEYIEPIEIAQEGQTTLKFVAVNGALTSDVVTQTYTVDTIAPEPVTATPAGGQVAETTNVTLASAEDAAVYYTLDGTEPTAASSLYSQPFQVSAGQTLKAVAIDAAGNVSALGTWEFTADTDTGGDTGTDTGGDTGTDTGGDTGTDTGGDTGTDTGGDTGTDTGGDTGTDTGGDTGTDTGGDTGTDTGGDTGTDTGGDTGTDTGGDTSFSDVGANTMWEEQIHWGAAQEITKGYKDGTFRPHANTNRDAMAAFLYRLAGEPEFQAPEKSPFVDYGKNNKFYKEVTWLYEKGITTGWTDGKEDTTVEYRPFADITREAMAAFLYRFASMEGDAIAGPPADYEGPAESPFVDYARDDKFYKEVAWLAEQEISNGWVNGPNDTTAEYRAFEPINRDATMVFMWRLAGQG